MSSAQECIHVRSPLRIDFVGMTDYVPFCRQFGGSIINATISKYLYTTAALRKDEKIILSAPDHGGLRVEIPCQAVLNPDGELGLAQEIVRRFPLEQGLELTTYSEMPAGSGLGSSSAIATCIIAAMDALTGYRLSYYEMAEMARECETAALHTTYGWQDQYSPVTGGGVKFMKHWPAQTGRGIEVNHIPLNPAQLARLGKSLVVCYTGISRPAKAVLDAVAAGVEANDQSVVRALCGMNDRAEDIRLCLLTGRLGELGSIIAEVWALHKQLHPDVTNDHIEQLYEIAFRAGATGGRVCGAGGGGTMLFWCDGDSDYAVKRALSEVGAQVLDCSIDTLGLLLW